MDFFFSANSVLLLHFLLSALLVTLMAQSKRLNAKLVPPGPGRGFTPVAPRLPDRKARAQSLLKMKLEMTAAAYNRRKVHGRAYQSERKRIAVTAALRCRFEIAAAFVWVLCKDIEWFLRERLRCLPGAKTGMYVNVAAAWLQIAAFSVLYDVFNHTNFFGLSRAWSPEVITTAAGWLHLYFGYMAPLLMLGLILMFSFLRNAALYYDFFGIVFLLFIAVYRLLICAREQCCFGIPFAWGVYNAHMGTTVFPSQYLEAAAALLGVVLCVVYMLAAKSYRPGRTACLALFWYAPTRFAAEFFRYTGENYRPNLVKGRFGLSVVHWACITAAILAAAAWFLLPAAKKLLDAIGARGRALWAAWRKHLAGSAPLRDLRARVLANCPAPFRQQYEVDLP